MKSGGRFVSRFSRYETIFQLLMWWGKTLREVSMDKLARAQSPALGAE